MTTEQQPEQINPSEKESKQGKAERQPKSRRLAYKSVLTAVVVGIVVISALSLSKIQRQEIPLDELQIQDSNTPAREVIKAPELEVGAGEDKVEQIDQRLTSLSGRIDRGFEAQVALSADVKKSLASWLKVFARSKWPLPILRKVTMPFVNALTTPLRG